MLTYKHYIGYSFATLITLWAMFFFTQTGFVESIKMSALLSGFLIPMVLLCVYAVKYLVRDPYANT